jgi:hypothetical protein
MLDHQATRDRALDLLRDMVSRNEAASYLKCYYSGIVARVLMELLRRSHADLMYI